MGRGFILFDHLVIAGDVLVEHVTLPEALVAELAVVGVHVGEVDVLDVLVGGASVLEGLGAEPTAEAKQRAAADVAALQVLRETGLGTFCHKGKKCVQDGGQKTKPQRKAKRDINRKAYIY